MFLQRNKKTVMLILRWWLNLAHDCTMLHSTEPFIIYPLLSQYDFSNVKRDIKHQIIIIIIIIIFFWMGVVGWGKGVLGILHHKGIQLILAYIWARPAALAAGGLVGNVFTSVSSLSFIFLFLPCSSLSSPLLSLLSLFSLSLGDNTKWPNRVDVSLNPNTKNPHLKLCW